MAGLSRICIVVSLFSATLVLSGCQNRVAKYPLGQNRYMISVSADAWTNHDDLKAEWYKKVNKVCNNKFSVEKIEEKNRTAAPYPSMSGRLSVIEGTVKCR